jgi:hypothetical protein
MELERVLRLMGGAVVLLSLGLAKLHNPNWLYLTAFAGLNLFQSGLTNWCPAVWILSKMGLRRCGERAEAT